MIIKQPKLRISGNECIIETDFELNGIWDTLWYKLPLEYQSFVVTDKVDAALVALLPLAMKKEEDIYLKGKVSSKLFYGISTYLITAIRLAYPEYKKIKIYPDVLTEECYSNKSVSATGVSCGVDSFATIATHQNLNNNFDLKYLTYLNAGSHGVYGGEISKAIYEKRLSKIKEFSKREDFPLIIMSSNIMEKIKVNFQSLHTLIHISCILNLQKGINVYYYASSFRLDYFSLKSVNSSWDTLILNFLQTETLSFFSSASQYSRYERTSIVADYEPSYEFLDVCTRHHQKDKINCSACEKCVRTQFTLELLGKLELYKNVFDFEVYKKSKDNFIAQLILTKKQNQTNQELFSHIKDSGQIKLGHYFFALIILCRKIFRKFYQTIRK